MKICIFDTETSGFSPIYNDLMQLSYQVVDTDNNWKIIKEFDRFFTYPEASRISQDAVRINGITKERVEKEGYIQRYQGLEDFFQTLKECDLLVGHNIEFDLKFMKGTADLQKYDLNGYTWPRCYCTMKPMTTLVKAKNQYGGYKYPKLSELSDWLKIDKSDIKLHDSKFDVELTKRCLKLMIEQGYFHDYDCHNVEFYLNRGHNNSNSGKTEPVLTQHVYIKSTYPVDLRDLILNSYYSQVKNPNSEVIEFIKTGIKFKYLSPNYRRDKKLTSLTVCRPKDKDWETFLLGAAFKHNCLATLYSIGSGRNYLMMLENVYFQIAEIDKFTKNPCIKLILLLSDSKYRFKDLMTRFWNESDVNKLDQINFDSEDMISWFTVNERLLRKGDLLLENITATDLEYSPQISGFSNPVNS